MEHHQNTSNLLLLLLKHKTFSLLLLLLLFTNFTLASSSSPYNYHNNIPRLSPFLKKHNYNSSPSSSSLLLSTNSPSDFKKYYYKQTLDHFNFAPESYATFDQKYVVNSKYWGGSASNSPIFAYLGAEEPLDDSLYLDVIGFLTDNAPRFKALLVYIEHRFYGDSNPVGAWKLEEAMKNKSMRGYFNSAQAIADFAEVLLHVKTQFSSPHSPIIVLGGSYGGMLASWFRLKYPHIALGALASSAPILYFDNITPQNGYFSIVTQDFKTVSKKCYETIRKSWSVIDEAGPSILSKRFKTCSKLKKSLELKDFLESIYSFAAQYNDPPVTLLCAEIVNHTHHHDDDDILSRIFSGVVASFGNLTCFDTNYFRHPTQTNIGWRWQTCSEIVIPIGRGSKEDDTMFQPSPFIMSEFFQQCNNLFGVLPRPHWVTTYYGGHDIKLILQRFASNIIFSNGLRDPYSSGGVLEDISESIHAVYTTEGSHCLDILPATKSDPEWLVEQRKLEVDIIHGWLSKYYDDLLAFTKP